MLRLHLRQYVKLSDQYRSHCNNQQHTVLHNFRPHLGLCLLGIDTKIQTFTGTASQLPGYTEGIRGREK